MAECSVIVPVPALVGAGCAPLARSVQSMLHGGTASQPHVVVAVAKPLLGDVRACLAEYGLSSVALVGAGDPGTRVQCIRAALKHLADQSISGPYLLIHDLRRPLCPTAVRDRVVAGLRSGASVVMPAVPVVDSVKAVDSVGSVSRTVDRTELRAVQYPRGFASETLSRLVSRCATDDFDELDEAVGAGLTVTIVKGDSDAFVVEMPRDAALVAAVIEARQAGHR